MKKTSFYIFFLILLSQNIIAQKGILRWNLDHKYNSYVFEQENAVFTFLDSIYTNHSDIEFVKSRFLPSVLKQWSLPTLMGRIVDAGYWEQNPNYYEPVLLGLVDIEKDYRFIAKVAMVSKGDSTSIKWVYNLSIVYDKEAQRFYLDSYIDWFTKDWFKVQVGNINFIKQSQDKLNLDNAKKLNNFNDSIAKIFKVPSKKFNYYSCKDPFQLYNVIGFDYSPNMFFARNGGRFNVENGNSTIYSGSNTEYYPHELVHAYMGDYAPKSLIANEGVATYFGGSGGLSYKEILPILDEYVSKNNLDITILFYASSTRDINSEVSTIYATGAFLTDLIFRKGGMSGLKQFFQIPENELSNRLSQIFEIKSTDLNVFLKEKLRSINTKD